MVSVYVPLLGVTGAVFVAEHVEPLTVQEKNPLADGQFAGGGVVQLVDVVPQDPRV